MTFISSARQKEIVVTIFGLVFDDIPGGLRH